tara:strand:- start:210 stop:383 length:174 start_codon:yes stop_codon:yes gene_type:complete
MPKILGGGPNGGTDIVRFPSLMILHFCLTDLIYILSLCDRPAQHQFDVFQQYQKDLD